MNSTETVMKISQKTGVAPEICEQVIKALEQTLQEELRNKPGARFLNRIAGFVQNLTSSK